MKNNNSNPLIFTLRKNEIEGRLDVSYYNPAYRKIYEKLEKCPFKIFTLKSISQCIFSGMTPLSKGSDYTTKNNGIPFIRSGDLREDDIIDFDSLLYIKKETHQKMKSSQLKEGDLLIAIVGATIGRVCVYTYREEANINQAIAGVRLKEDINPFYVKWFLLTNLGQTQLNRLKRPVARANINLEEVGFLKVPVPPPKIQNKIVAIMDKALKEKREKEKKAENLLNSIDNYLMQELSISLPEFEEKSPLIYEIGSEFFRNERWDVEYWEPKYRKIIDAIQDSKYRAEKLGRFIKEINYGASVKNIYSEDGIPLLRILNLRPNEIDLSDLVKVPYEMKKEIGNSYVQEGDFLISRSGTIGIVAIVPKEADGFAFGSYMIRFKIKEDSGLNKFYLSVVLNSVIGRIQTQRSKIGAIQTNITIPSIKNLVIPLPPKSIQDKIANEVKTRIEIAKKLQKKGEQTITKAKKEIERIILGETNYE